MPHYVTNRGKLLLAQGDWDDAGASTYYIGLLAGSTIPVGIDTEAEIQDLNTVADLLGVASVDEPAGGWYARQNLSRTAAAEDDTNNRVNLGCVDPVWAAATAGTDIYGAYIAKEIGADSADELMSVILLGSVTTTNGGSFTLDFTDVYRIV